MTTIKEIYEASRSDDIEVCTIRIANVTSSRKAKEIFNLVQPEQVKIIDIKIESKSNKQAEPAEPGQEDRILPEFGLQSPHVVLQTNLHKNKINNIQSLLGDMMTKGSCVKVKFNLNKKHYKLKEMQNINPSEASAAQNKVQTKVLELDAFLQSLREKYLSDPSLPVKPSVNPEEAKEAADFENDAKAFLGLGKKPSWTNNAGERKSALMAVVGDPRLLKRIFNNKELGAMYFHYVGLRKNLNPPQVLKFRRSYETKKVVPCQNMQLGIMNPKNPGQFCSYWDFAKLKEQTSDLHFVFWQLTGKPSKRVQVVFEVPSLNKFVKIEFSFKLCENIYEEQGDGETYNLYFELAYSPRFAVMGYNDTYYQNHVFCEQWDRIPHFGLNPEADSLFNAYLTQYTVIKLTFPRPAYELKIFSQIVKSVGMEVTSYFSPHFQTVDIEETMPYLTYNKIMSSKLSHEAKFAMLACLSQKKINLYEVSRGVLDELEEKNSVVVEKTLKDIGNKNRKLTMADRSQLARDFMNFFLDLYEENRISRGQWETAKTPEHMCKTKRVTITPTIIIYYTEEAELSNSVLRRFKNHTGQFLRVTLSDEVGEGVKNMVYISETRFKALLRDLPILGESYKALAYSSSQLKNNSLWMLKETQQLSVEKIHREIGDLSDIRNPARYAARLGQLFSASFAALTIKFDEINVREIPDITVETNGNKYNFSDGVGKISMDLLNQIKVTRKLKGIVSAIQIRCGGVKGILVGDPKLNARTICFRKSMIKFNESSFNNRLELLDYSKYRPGYLNRQIILLLLSNNLSPLVFQDLQEENITDLTRKENNDGNIFAYINNEHHMSPTKDLLKDCVDAEIEIGKEPFVRGVVETIRIRSFINLKEKCNIMVRKSTRLTGVLDEYGILNHKEMYVCISPSNGEDKTDFQVIKAERVVITKNPCLHAGDIRVLKAVDNAEVRARFAHLVNVIVFPTKGPRPHTDEISGSDLDGDMYFVSWDERLIPNEITEPMSYAGKKPEDRVVNMDEIVSFFIEYANNDVLGRIDNSHLALADQSKDLAKSLDCLNLAELHAVAVDYAKTGVCPALKGSFAKFFPDYMEKESDMTVESTTVMGDLYRFIRSEIESTGLKKIYKDGSKVLQPQLITIDEDMVQDGFENNLEEAFEALEEYYKETHAVMNLYKIQTEFEIFSGNFLKFMSKGKSKKYNLEKLQEKMIEHIEILTEKLAERLLSEFETTEQMIQDNKYIDAVRERASAVYIASYYRGRERCEIERINKAMDKIGYKEVFEPKFAKYETQLIGLPWFIFKEVILEIKKENIMKRQQNRKKKV